MSRSTDIATTLNAALKRNSLKFDAAGDGGYRRLNIPPEGIPLRDMAVFSIALGPRTVPWRNSSIPPRRALRPSPARGRRACRS